ncbi:MAG TPA: hypothetical protein PLL75_03890 [Candidatus Omnitrophota bacterium]|nr:hypothetical protein [Candidatus Omnitrophota bacterium]HPS36849.1 hypothetical protein [Candidatus Omnitrophota bacterium]
MSFPELLSEVLKLKRDEKRTQTDDYLEVVVSKAVLPEFEKVLESYFGPAIKPFGKGASGDANRYSKPYGGIREDQGMYFRKEEGGNELALLWPWGSGTPITIKIIREKSKAASGGFSLGALFGKK